MPTLERGALREALLGEVRAVCTSDGPEAVSIARIARKLGVSSGAPFRLFPSREHIFAALVEAELTRLDRAFAAIVAQPEADPAARLRALCAAYVDHARSEPAMFRLTFSMSATALGADALLALGERVYGKVRDTVAACLPGESDPDEIELRSYMLWSAVHGHALLRIAGQIEDQGIEIADETVIAEAVRQVSR